MATKGETKLATHMSTRKKPEFLFSFRASRPGQVLLTDYRTKEVEEVPAQQATQLMKNMISIYRLADVS